MFSMSSYFTLHWAAIAISLFNTVLLLWLGATVLLNADRRTWGIWLGGGGLLLGSAFFVSHTVVLDLDWKTFGRGLHFWWYAGLAPAVLLPLGWYVVMLWYAGFWNSREAALYRRQRFMLPAVLVIAGAGLLAVVVYANPIPRLVSTLPLRFLVHGLGGSPLLVAGYAVYLVTCSALTLDALLRPGPTERVMGHLARRRARRWLVVASILLLLVSLGVIAVLLWVLLNMRQGAGYVVTEPAIIMLERFDLILSILVAAAVIVLGQAIVAYEIFAGKTLPRRGLRRQWHQALLLAAGYSALVGLTLTLQVPPVYSILLATVLTAAFLALLSWRTFAERERYIAHLRPFVASQRLYDHLLWPQGAPEADSEGARAKPAAGDLFQALCRHVLGARLGFLVPLGPLAPLAGPPLLYPPGRDLSLPSLDDVVARCTDPQTTNIPLDPEHWAGAAWAIPLWNERGLIGLLLLGEKEDGGFYTQEEMEIARASGERLVDAQAGAEMARRLLMLQRRQLAESQVVDRRARRILHDEVLPQLHTALLALDADGSGAGREAAVLLGEAHRRIADLLRDFPAALTPAVTRLGLLGALRRVVDEELGPAFDQVAWEISPAAAQKLAQISPVTGEVLFYAVREAIRNAARHGADPASSQPHSLRISAACEDGLEVAVEDNGVGLQNSAADGGSGQGLALHSTMMAVIGGALTVDSVPGEYTRVRFTLGEEALDLQTAGEGERGRDGDRKLTWMDVDPPTSD